MKKIFLCLISFSLVSCFSSFKKSSDERTPATAGQVNLDFEVFIEILKDRKVQNIEEALMHLRNEFPEYMKMHTLMYESFSLHESTFQEPRVIVFGPKAEFVLTFNGGLHRRGGNAFEIMQYNQETATFEFREVAFKSPDQEKLPDMLSASDIEFENSNFRYTKANPQKCLSCHGQSPRPIWDTYFLWPGAYGGNDDILTSLFHKEEVRGNPNFELLLEAGLKPGHSQGRLFDLKPGVKDQESFQFQQFISARGSHQRYQYLPLRAVDLAFVEMGQGKPIETIDTSSAILKDSQDLGRFSPFDVRFLYRPNLNLNDRLNTLTMKSLFQRTLNNQRTQKLAPLISWQMLCSKRSTIDNFNISAAQENINPTTEIARFLSSEELKKIEITGGTWKDFYRRFLKEELLMQAEKIQRFERVFGKNSLKLGPLEGSEKSLPPTRNLKYYRNILGRNLDQYETIAARDESDDLYLEAAIAYVALGFDVQMQDYATSLRRVPTMREFGYNLLLEELSQKYSLELTSNPCPGIVRLIQASN